MSPGKIFGRPFGIIATRWTRFPTMPYASFGSSRESGSKRNALAPNTRRTIVKLKRLAINRLPGSASHLNRSGGSGFNVVYGPNGIGKSSLCRAVEGLYWEDRGPSKRTSVRGEFELDGESLWVELKRFTRALATRRRGQCAAKSPSIPQLPVLLSSPARPDRPVAGWHARYRPPRSGARCRRIWIGTTLPPTCSPRWALSMADASDEITTRHYRMSRRRKESSRGLQRRADQLGVLKGQLAAAEVQRAAAAIAVNVLCRFSRAPGGIRGRYKRVDAPA